MAKNNPSLMIAYLVLVCIEVAIVVGCLVALMTIQGPLSAGFLPLMVFMEYDLVTTVGVIQIEYPNG